MTLSAQLVEPAWHTSPGYTRTLGPEVAELSELAGFIPDPEQRLILDDVGALDVGGKAASFEVVVVAGRQNLKTGAFKSAVLGWLFIFDKRLVTWSAHEFSTAQRAFKDMEALICGCAALSRRVKKIHYGNGEEAIELMTGQELLFKARTNTGGRGLTGDGMILDEAFALRPLHMGALMPTLSAVPDPQILYGSSAGLVQSDVLRDLRDRGRAGGDPSLSYWEFCDDLPGGCATQECGHHRTAVGCRLDDRARWQRANPAMGRRISVEHIAKERRSLPPAEFARERLGWWDDPPGLAGRAFDLAAWDRLVDAGSSATGALVYGIATTIDRSHTSIAVAGARADSDVHVDLGERRRDSDWVVPRCVELDAKHGPVTFVVGGGDGPAAAFIPALEAAGLTVVPGSLSDYRTACSLMVDALKDGTLRHRGQPELDDAVQAAVWRSTGDGAPVVGRRASGEDVTAAEAVIWAHWGARTLDTGGVSVHGFDDLDLCDTCGKQPHEDPDGAFAYMCQSCREVASV